MIKDILKYIIYAIIVLLTSKLVSSFIVHQKTFSEKKSFQSMVKKYNEGKVYGKNNFNEEDSYDKIPSNDKLDYSDGMLRIAALIVNKNLPMMIDKETRYNSVTIDAGPAWVYNLTLINYNFYDIDWQELEPLIYANMLKYVCLDPKMKEMMIHNVIIVYKYYSSDNRELGSIVFNRKICFE